MLSRKSFAREIARQDLDHAGRAIAILWYYAKSGDFEERTAADLAADLAEEGFSRPHTTRLRLALQQSTYTIRGKRPGTFRINLRRQDELDTRYAPTLGIPQAQIADTVLPSQWAAGRRAYLERIIEQINGSYQYGFYDACATLCRRLMESLLIEIYVFQSRQGSIQHADGTFYALADLIRHTNGDRAFTLSRGISRTMSEIKDIGDRAAHHRVYVTTQLDIDTIATRYRTLIRELLSVSGIYP